MALDGLLLHQISSELNEYLPCKISKIQNISDVELLWTLRTPQGSRKLLTSFHSTYNRIHLTRASYTTLESPSNFVMLLRKQLDGGFIRRIEQIGLDRVLQLKIEVRDELGDLHMRTLYAELMGKYANLVLVDEEDIITDALKQIFARTKSDVYIAAAYLVPGKHALGDLDMLKSRAISVNILTNSLASTDSFVVYAAWERYRDYFLKNGVRVYEYQYEGNKKNSRKKSGVRGKLSSGASLHSKTIVFDERITWVGSFNLDQRSSNLNTESVVVFDNPEFAKKTKAHIREEMADAWELWSVDSEVFWKGYNKDGVFEIHSAPPNASLFLRFFNLLAKILPESQI